MPTRPTLRFASGSSKEPYSSIWRVTADNAKGDVYISWSKKTADTTKVSLHESGIWRYAATKESGVTFEGGDRVISRWTRPPEHVSGVTRGPGILVPHTSVGSRTLFSEDLSPKVKWVRPPGIGEAVEFDIYFLEATAPRDRWGMSEIIGSLNLAHGRSVWVVASVRTDLPPLVFQCSEDLLRQYAAIHSSLDNFAGGSMIQTRYSEDALKTPVFIDLPQTARYRRADMTLSDPTAKGTPARGRSLTVRSTIHHL